MQEDILNVIENSIVLSELYEIIGYDRLIALLDQWGGRNLYVPTSYPSENHPLIKCVGRKAAEDLSWRYGGDALTVPTKTMIDRVVRNRNILKDRSQGETILTIARKYKLSQRSVYAILAKAGEPAHENPQYAKRPRVDDKEQMELFPKVG